MPLFRHIFSTAFFTIVSVPLFCCGETLTIVTPHPESIRRELTHHFAKWQEQNNLPPTTLDWRNVGGSGDTIRFIRSEYTNKPEGIGIDIFFGGGVDPYIDFKEEKLLTPIQISQDNLDAIPQNINGINLRDADNYWFGVTYATFGILHNLTVLKYNHLPQAQTWKELTNPKLYGWLAISDPRNSGSMFAMMAIILQYYGWDEGWQVLTGMFANAETVGRYATDPPRATTMGNAASSICIDFYGFTQIAATNSKHTEGETTLANQVMTLSIPDQATVRSPDCIAVLKGGNTALAKEFIDFLLSREGQRLWILPVGHSDGPEANALLRMPVRQEIYTLYSDFIPLDRTTSPKENENTTFLFDNAKAGKERSIIVALIGSALIDTHSELRKAWKYAIEHNQSIEELAKPLISEEEALALANSEEWKDPLKRNRLKINWQKEALYRYKEYLKN